MSRHPDYGLEFFVWDAWFGKPAQPQRVNADDFEEAAISFARQMHASGEEYGSYLIDVQDPEGRIHRVRVMPERVMVFAVSHVEGSRCAN